MGPSAGIDVLKTLAVVVALGAGVGVLALVAWRAWRPQYIRPLLCRPTIVLPRQTARPQNQKIPNAPERAAREVAPEQQERPVPQPKYRIFSEDPADSVSEADILLNADDTSRS